MASNNYGGALVEVSIIAFDGNIATINEALVNADININIEEAASQSKESSVYVDHNQVGKAVQIINGLGYETDEDN